MSEPVIYDSATGWRCAYPEHIGEPVQDRPRVEPDWSPLPLRSVPPRPAPGNVHADCAKVIARLTARAEAVEADRARLYALAGVSEPEPWLPDWVVDLALFATVIAILTGAVWLAVWLVPIVWHWGAETVAAIPGHDWSQVGAVAAGAATLTAAGFAFGCTRPLLHHHEPVDYSRRALFVICPTCGAAPHQPCRAGAGPTTLLTPHITRTARADHLWSPS